MVSSVWTLTALSNFLSTKEKMTCSWHRAQDNVWCVALMCIMSDWATWSCNAIMFTFINKARSWSSVQHANATYMTLRLETEGLHEWINNKTDEQSDTWAFIKQQHQTFSVHISDIWLLSNDLKCHKMIKERWKTKHNSAMMLSSHIF